MASEWPPRDWLTLALLVVCSLLLCWSLYDVRRQIKARATQQPRARVVVEDKGTQPAQEYKAISTLKVHGIVFINMDANTLLTFNEEKEQHEIADVAIMPVQYWRDVLRPHFEQDGRS